MRAVFMGTPDFAVPSLTALASAHEVAAVVTAPDKKRNRMELSPTPVAARAAELGLRVEKPDTLRDGAIAPLLAEVKPDVIVVAAYGKILPEYVLSAAKYGCVNVHGSLLPAYRGAAPMQRAVMDGVQKIGVTVMQMDAGLDTGDMLLKRAVALPPDADFEWVHDTLADLGAKALLEALDGLAAGTITPVAQDGALSTYAAKITKEECALDFTEPAAALHNKIRALSPVPLAYAFLGGRMIKIVRAAVSAPASAPAGTVVSVDGGITVACGEGTLTLTELLPEGKRRMSAADFARGRGVAVGDRFTKERS